jgi:hypothetical protein
MRVNEIRTRTFSRVSSWYDSLRSSASHGDATFGGVRFDASLLEPFSKVLGKDHIQMFV